MKIALAQLNYTVGALEKNKAKIISHIQKARKEGAELVVFSEFAISGFPGYELFNTIAFLEACEDALVEIASHCDDIAVLVGLPIQHGVKTVSAVALIQNRHIIKYVGKRHVVKRDDLGYIHSSHGCEYVTVGGHKLAVVVGDDVLVEREYGDYADIIVTMETHPYSRGIIEERCDYFSKLAYTTGKYLMGVNQVGGNTDILYYGASYAFNKSGEPIALLNGFEEDFVIVDTNNSHKIVIPAQNKTENVYKAIKLGLKDYFDKNNFSKACIGLSGGIDSAVVLAMAVEALGAENVRALMMPSQFSSDHSVNDAIEMAENLGVEFDVIPIEESYKALHESLTPILGGTGFNVAEENMQARIRMVMLMALSNKFGHILLNTSNKSEAAVGYDTLYGDSAGSLGVIGDLYKIEVYSLARYINRRMIVIPEKIIAKEPSAELRPDQKDSDSLPPYEVLDAILFRLIEEGQRVYEIIDAGFEDGTVRNVVKMLQKSEYKRFQACPVLRLSSRPFGNGYKLPLINHFII